MTQQGIGARLVRKEDDRYMRGRGQYVGDIRLPGMHGGGVPAEPAGACAHQGIRIPPAIRARVFIAEDLAACRPSAPTPRCRGSSRRCSRSWHGQGALCRRTGRHVRRAHARRGRGPAAEIELDLDPLPAVADMLEARKAGAPLVHEHWGDNLYLTTHSTWTSRP
jgi:carbon-monoxide dehydrogenase large subunit